MEGLAILGDGQELLDRIRCQFSGDDGPRCASVVEVTGSRKTMYSRYETNAEPVPCKGELTEISAKRRPNNG